MTLFEGVRVISFEPPAVSEPMDVAVAGPDKGKPGAFGNAEGDASEDIYRAEGFREVGDGYQRHSYQEPVLSLQNAPELYRFTAARPLYGLLIKQGCPIFRTAHAMLSRDSLPSDAIPEYGPVSPCPAPKSAGRQPRWRVRSLCGNRPFPGNRAPRLRFRPAR